MQIDFEELIIKFVVIINFEWKFLRNKKIIKLLHHVNA